MLLNLFVISRMCWEILAKKQINIENTDLPVYQDLLDQIYDLYPLLDPDEDFKLFWQCSADELLPIYDFLSFSAFFKFGATNTICLLINDSLKHYLDTRPLIRKLDVEDMRKEKIRAKSKYDVTITPTKAIGCTCSELNITDDDEDDLFETDEEIIFHALRHEPVRGFWTADNIFKYQVIESVKKGWSKNLKKLDKQYYEGESLESKLKKRGSERR